MNSALYVGTIRHRRFSPVAHNFVYPVFMPWIDLDELASLASTVRGFGSSLLSIARFKRSDYLAGDKTLKQAVRDKVEQLTGERVEGKVFMLCQLRYCGLYFSPLNLYYLYDESNQWRYMLAEVSNTPWNKRHYYVIPAVSRWEGRHWNEQKAFHVSPFNPMEQRYQWRLNEPDERLFVHMENHPEYTNSQQQEEDGNQGAGKVFDATMALQRHPFTSAKLLALMVRTPVMAVKVVAGIYYQAFRLWLKGAPFYSHPDSTEPKSTTGNTHQKSTGNTNNQEACSLEKTGAHDVKK